MGNNQKPAVATEQGALAVRKLTFWEAALIKMCIRDRNRSVPIYFPAEGL